MKLHSIAIMWLVLLSGCTERVSTDDVGDGGGIEVFTSVNGMTYDDGQSYTKALTTNDMALTGVQFLRVDNADPNLAGGVINYSSTATITANRAATSGKITFTSPTSLQYDKQTNNTAYLAAYHPAPQSVTGGVATWAAAQMNDIIISGNYSAGKYTSDIRPVMSFEHKLCRIEVVVRAAAGTDIGKVRSRWGKITGISLTSYSNYDYNYSNQVFSGSGSAVLGFKSATDYSSAMAAVDVQAAGGTVVNGAALMMPQSSGSLALTVTGEKSTETITVTMGGPLVAGKVHKVLVDVKGEGDIPPLPYHPCIKVGNLWWTTGNLIADAHNRCTIGYPTDGGLYFQFGSLIGWTGGATGNGMGIPPAPTNDAPKIPVLGIAVKPGSYTGSTDWGFTTRGSGYFKDQSVTSGVVTNLVIDNPTTGIGDACRYYLGGTWRLPTSAEYVALWGTPPETNGPWQDTPAGRTINGLFFPTAGYRAEYNGSIFMSPKGCYWSASVTSATTGNNLFFNINSVTHESENVRYIGFPVRCVSQ